MSGWFWTSLARQMARVWRRRASASGLLLALLCVGLPVQAAEPAGNLSPEATVQSVSDAVLTLIEEAREYARDDPERFYQQITAILDPNVDFDSFSRSVMAVYYRDATAAQRQRFADSFKWGLVRTYSLALTEFSNGTITVLPPTSPLPAGARMQNVQMKVVTPSGNVYPVQYAMGRGADGRWRVRNIIVNGINIGLTYRNQFAGAMSDPANGGSLDKVIDGWSDMLQAEGQALEEKLAAEAAAQPTP